MYRFSNALAKQINFKISASLMSVKRLSIILFAVSFTSLAYSNNFAAKAKPIVIMDGNNNSRTCLYEGKAYSLGAVILVGSVYLDCVPEKQIETDGRLMWEKTTLEIIEKS